VHFAGYETDEDAIGQIERYLRDEAAREAIARAGRAEVLSRHTYRHRAEEIIRCIFDSRIDPEALRMAARPSRLWGMARLKALDQIYKVQWRLHQWLDC
ncbi:MAG: glycosyltransferase family 1 protein, partial [Elusimicrobia bacterium]|nr:glycosyltransferase family 1 protein [Elusimicrobiota bacterium]